MKPVRKRPSYILFLKKDKSTPISERRKRRPNIPIKRETDRSTIIVI
jgi:hypothetical protein